jgi:hypothetical protein
MDNWLADDNGLHGGIAGESNGSGKMNEIGFTWNHNSPFLDGELFHNIS